jgi:L-lysine 2,3-aminomutase
MNEPLSIPATTHSVGAENENRPASWQRLLKEAIRDPGELCRILRLPQKYHAAAFQAARDFPLFAPRGYVARMRPGDPNDPLLLQVLPLADELSSPPDFRHDPVGDEAAAVVPGLLHKYQGRVLLITTGACAIHCRYCFRRHFPYAEAPHSLAQWEPAIEAIAGSRNGPNAWPKSSTSSGCGFTRGCRSFCLSGFVPSCSTGSAARG